ncbi:MAG: cytochrome c, partial [Planctomycetota bacterium]|nr:cytochrome c [Planctomycetota bacterium]
MTTRKRTLYLTLLLIYVATMEQAIPQEPSGIVLFRKHCSHCHGNNGAGRESYPDPLRGNLSVTQLASYIDKEMPEDDPSQVTGETAEIIAETIHSSFYSRIAQEKKRKARLDLS